MPDLPPPPGWFIQRLVHIDHDTWHAVAMTCGTNPRSGTCHGEGRTILDAMLALLAKIEAGHIVPTPEPRIVTTSTTHRSLSDLLASADALGRKPPAPLFTGNLRRI